MQDQPSLSEDGDYAMSANLEHEVDARGSAYIILALDLAPFVKPSSREALEHIRGGGIFDDYLESLNLNNSSFARDSNYSNQWC